MKKFITPLATALLSVGAVTAVPVDLSAAYNAYVELTEFADGPSAAKMYMNIYNLGTNTVNFEVWMGEDGIVQSADIRAVFFNFDEPVPIYNSISISDATNITADPDELISPVVYGFGDKYWEVYNLPKDAQPNGGSPKIDWDSFDGGAVFGEQGDDGIMKMSFTMTASSAIDLDYLGGRAKSVAIIGGLSGQSSKLYGVPVPDLTPVPEPASVALIGVGATLAGLIRSRKRFAQA
ncbi:MAG: PEP-CTERM sorting domain-containing protein [Chlorobiaceae bacterium]|nr:PEP-CTERM sorting domain-containing protein [Chlorobiaceae bacterium]